MTNRQYKICKIILKKRALKKILKQTGLANAVDLYEELGENAVIFSDYDFNDTTEVGLTDRMTEQVESRKRSNTEKYANWFLTILGLGIAIAAYFRP